MPIFNKSRAIIEKFPPRMGKSTSNHPWRRRLLSLHYGRYGCAYPHRAQPTRRHTLLKNPLQQRKNNGASSSILWFTNALLDNREAGYSFAKASVTHMRHTLTLLANRNLQVLLLSQMIFVAGGAMTVTVGGIIGSQLAPTQALSTLPLSLTVLGTALGAVPATGIMQRFGRKKGFISAALIAFTSCLLAIAALIVQDFALYCGSTLLIGLSLAFSQQFRFAAAEVVSIDRAGSAISIILLGSVGGAIIGPELVTQSHVIWPDQTFAGAIAGMGMLFLVAALLLQALTLTSDQRNEPIAQPDPRALRIIAREPLFLLAIAAGVVGQGIMSFVMTATPVSMHVMDGHSMSDTADVIRAHVLAMYLPSLASGWLITQFGERRLMAMGLALYGLTMAAAWSGQAVIHYSIALTLLGVGWNFLFVGGTTLLVKTYRPAERFRAQGLNEAMVFGTSALASLLAGMVLSGVGWQAIVMGSLAPIGLLGIALYRYRHRALPDVADYP